MSERRLGLRRMVDVAASAVRTIQDSPVPDVSGIVSALNRRVGRRTAVAIAVPLTIGTWELVKTVAGGAEIKIVKATSPDADREHKKSDGPVVETGGKGEIVVEQGDSSPIVNGVPNKGWRDSNANTALITVYPNKDNGQAGQQVLVDNGDDWGIFTWDDCPTSTQRSYEGALARAMRFAQEQKDMKEQGTGASGRKWERADIKVFGQDKGQGE